MRPIRPSQVPIPFELSADTSDLDERGTYSLRATITGPDGGLQWTTDTANIIDTVQGEVDLGMVMLVRAGDGATGVDTDVASSPLVGEWTITDIDGIEPLADAPATITFGDDDTMSLDTGCNTLSASYGIDGDALSIDSEPAMTLMACDTERTAQETAVVAIIGSVRTDGATFEISDDTTLTITTIEGTTLTVER